MGIAVVTDKKDGKKRKVPLIWGPTERSKDSVVNEFSAVSNNLKMLQVGASEYGRFRQMHKM
ncbi:hypothetical protein K8R62_00890 [bacterium]|nr:hypothetical protein [bacterium]